MSLVSMTLYNHNMYFVSACAKCQEESGWAWNSMAARVSWVKNARCQPATWRIQEGWTT